MFDMKAFLDNLKYSKWINLSGILSSFACTLLSILTIVLYEYKIVLTFTLLLIPFIYILLVFVYRNLLRIKILGLHFNDYKTYINLDTPICFIIFIVGFALSSFGFSSLYLLIAFIICFIYQCIIFEIENKTNLKIKSEEEDE